MKTHITRGRRKGTGMSQKETPLERAWRIQITIQVITKIKNLTGMNQSQIASAAGYRSHTVISDWVHGRRPAPLWALKGMADGAGLHLEIVIT